MTGTTWAPGEKRRLTALAVGLVTAMLYPLRQHLRPRDEQVDSYPLSYYPMFRDLRAPRVTVTHAIGIDAEGGRHYLTAETLVAGVGFNQARKQLNRAARGERAEEHARMLAARVAADPALGHIARVELVRGVFDLDTCLLADPVTCEEITERVAGAAVAGRPQPPEPPR